MESNYVCRKKENGLGFDTHITIIDIPVSICVFHSSSYRENTTSLSTRTISQSPNSHCFPIKDLDPQVMHSPLSGPQSPITY